MVPSASTTMVVPSALAVSCTTAEPSWTVSGESISMPSASAASSNRSIIVSWDNPVGIPAE